MTFSILARDGETGALGGAAATGSLCVGGWVLRGDIRAGMSASQGAAPSTMWGEDVLAGMRLGRSAGEVVADVTGADTGREWRQLSALDQIGRTGVFSGQSNTPVIAAHEFDGGVVAGNMLANDSVPRAAAEGYLSASGSFAERLLAGLMAGRAAGSDSRGLLSAALLVVRRDAAPLTLRIDYHPEDPLDALAALLKRATSGEYAAWAAQVPTLDSPERVLDRPDA
ncbi:DUF1028 domain-containing protein [Acidimangrovimonas sediminis]|uniref:DUF1028 domain-containing protein n=1 Tax=Acidimangrovimonas sediminis TaxID=2056283 RepID=UPI000C8055A8|nr:DUF1028 domain-containing protein [Acidimangrovimonas sediminis]